MWSERGRRGKSGEKTIEKRELKWEGFWRKEIEGGVGEGSVV
jgi:hypothetical protein